jgi:hypothetical protein
MNFPLDKRSVWLAIHVRPPPTWLGRLAAHANVQRQYDKKQPFLAKGAAVCQARPFLT